MRKEVETRMSKEQKSEHKKRKQETKGPRPEARKSSKPQLVTESKSVIKWKKDKNGAGPGRKSASDRVGVGGLVL